MKSPTGYLPGVLVLLDVLPAYYSVSEHLLLPALAGGEGSRGDRRRRKNKAAGGETYEAGEQEERRPHPPGPGRRCVGRAGPSIYAGL